jgi:hypothetical protein
LELIDPNADALVVGDANLTFSILLARHREARRGAWFRTGSHPGPTGVPPGIGPRGTNCGHYVWDNRNTSMLGVWQPHTAASCIDISYIISWYLIFMAGMPKIAIVLSFIFFKWAKWWPSKVFPGSSSCPVCVCQSYLHHLVLTGVIPMPFRHIWNAICQCKVAIDPVCVMIKEKGILKSMQLWRPEASWSIIKRWISLYKNIKNRAGICSRRNYCGRAVEVDFALWGAWK